MSLADGCDQVDDPSGEVVVLALQPQPLLGVQRGELAELLALARLVGVQSVHLVDAHQRVVLLAGVALVLTLRTDRADHVVALSQGVLLDQPEAQVGIGRSGQVAGRAQERVVVQHVEDARHGDEDLVVGDLGLGVITTTVAVAVPVAVAATPTAVTVTALTAVAVLVVLVVVAPLAGFLAVVLVLTGRALLAVVLVLTGRALLAVLLVLTGRALLAVLLRLWGLLGGRLGGLRRSSSGVGTAESGDELALAHGGRSGDALVGGHLAQVGQQHAGKAGASLAGRLFFDSGVSQLTRPFMDVGTTCAPRGER